MTTTAPRRVPFPTCDNCRYHHTRYSHSTDPNSPTPKRTSTCYLTRRHVSPRMIACPLFLPPSTRPTPA